MKRSVFLAGAALALLPLAAQAERGADGSATLLYWQAASHLNPYLSGIAKETEAASLVLEPLARFDDEGRIFPVLAAEIPTHQNGGFSADRRSLTWKLREGVKWSDGTALTARDVVFTWKYCTTPGGGCAAANVFAGVADVAAPDDATVVITFDRPTPYPYLPFVSSTVPILQEAQFAGCLGEKMAQCSAQNFAPVGTGPFVVESFAPNDVATFTANPQYRDPARPALARVVIKGGGDAVSAARAVFETGEVDYAWNLQISPDVLDPMVAKGKGDLVTTYGSLVEFLFLNQTDPSPALGDKRSTVEGGAHPVLTDPRVREALSLAIDRPLLAEALYGAMGKPTCNVVPAPAQYVSTDNDACLTADPDRAKALLDEAGWVPGADGIRTKDGRRLAFDFLAPTSAIRQDTQSLLKEWWKEIGVETSLRNVPGSVFFGGDAGSPDTRQKFYADIEIYTDNSKGLDQESFLKKWTCASIPSPANQWQGANAARHCAPDYDALAAKFGETDGFDARAGLARELNDMLVQSYTMIPLIHRGSVSGKARSLEGVKINAWDSELWNIADWHRAK